MVRTISIGLALIWLAGSAYADLDLTPQVTEYDLDGVKLKHLVFSDGAQRITYTPPRGWQYSGGGDRFTLHPPAGSSAEGVIDITKLAAPIVFDDAAMKRLSDQVIASLPSSASHVTLVSEQRNPVVIERKETFLVVINFESQGTPYSRSVMFLNRKNEQLRFQLTCPRWNFERLQNQFLSSQFSWENL